MRFIYLMAALFLFMIPCHAEETKPFSRTLSLQGISFKISSTNSGSLNKLNIVPDGLKEINKPIEREIEGNVNGAEIADLNSDGSPEIYIYVTSAGSGSYGSLVAYAVNQKKSLSEIFLTDIMTDPKLSKGYMGHDEFAVVENSLARRFPIYKDGDINSRATGGTRQIEYKLLPGEAGWVLRVKKSTDFK
jgi:hypothetical protein